MNAFTILQASEHVIAKSLALAEKDPHGIIITLVSVSMVFGALIMLYFAYTLIGKIASGQFKRPKRKTKASNEITEEVAAAIAMALDQEFNSETYAAIGMALHQYFNETAHDEESYTITIKRK